MVLSFEHCMLGSSSQDMVIRLQDSEIKLLEIIKDCIYARVQSDKEYARLLSRSCQKARGYDPVVKTPLMDVWSSVIEKTDALSEMVKKQADLIFSSTVDKLTTLIADRKAARQMFQEEKTRFEFDLSNAKAEVSRNYGEYSKAMQKVKAKRNEYDELLSRGKKVDDVRRKYNVLTDKLHRIHNDYVLSVKEGSVLQSGHLSGMLPMYLSAQQDYCQDSVTQCKSILSEYIQLSSTCCDESKTIHEQMRQTVATINPKKEYTAFIESSRSESDMESLLFDTSVLEDYNGILAADEITVDDMTFELLTQLQNAYADRIEQREPDIRAFQEQVNSVNTEIAEFPRDGNKSELVPKRRHLKYLERKLKESLLYKERQQQILDIIRDRLSKCDPASLPKASSLDSSSSLEQQNGLGMASNNGRPAETGLKSKLTKIFKPKLHGADSSDSLNHIKASKRPSHREEYSVVVPGTDGRPIKMTDDPGAPLEDEEWFHGILPREEVQRLLNNDGDYLVRESKKRATNESQYVLSVMWQGPKHFIIQTADGGWRLEGLAYPTIQELVINQHKSNSAVTNKSKAILKTPIMRETWQIKNDDIRLEDKIGNGNFGEVFKGFYKGNIVAVKTCKEDLQEDQKKKFIQEGGILRRYDHPNIVKFVGIAAQKNPVMIVMEFVSGGALLSWLRKNGMAEPKRSLIQMCLDAAKGMEYLESMNVIHRDLAARNCLVSESKKVKISDFGMSREEEMYEVTQGMKQIPIKWTAPEALNYGKYTSLCDVWSFGILIWEIFSAGKTPYPGMKNQEARDRVDKGYRMPSPEDCPTAVYSLMRDCWEERPERRPHFEGIVKELEEALRSHR